MTSATSDVNAEIRKKSSVLAMVIFQIIEMYILDVIVLKWILWSLLPLAVADMHICANIRNTYVIFYYYFYFQKGQKKSILYSLELNI